VGSRQGRGPREELDRVLYELADGSASQQSRCRRTCLGRRPEILQALGQPDDVSWDNVAPGRTVEAAGIAPAAPLFPRVDAPTAAARDRYARAPRRARRSEGRARARTPPPAVERGLSIGTGLEVDARDVGDRGRTSRAFASPQVSTRTRRPTASRSTRCSTSASSPSARSGSTSTATTRRATSSGASSPAARAGSGASASR
jgi:hypothetical protein